MSTSRTGVAIRGVSLGLVVALAGLAPRPAQAEGRIKAWGRRMVRRLKGMSTERRSEVSSSTTRSFARPTQRTQAWQGPAKIEGRRIGPIAKARAEALQNTERGSPRAYAKEVGKMSALSGLIGGGIGLLLGGVPGAVALGAKAAGSGLFFGHMFSGGMRKYSTRAFARADLAEIGGDRTAQRAFQLRGIGRTALEDAASVGVLNVGLTALLGGALLPAAATGIAAGAALGAVWGAGRAFVAPKVKRWLFDRKMGQVEKLLGQLEQNPADATLAGKLRSQAGKLQNKADRIPVLDAKRTERYESTMSRVGDALSSPPSPRTDDALAQSL